MEIDFDRYLRELERERRVRAHSAGNKLRVQSVVDPVLTVASGGTAP
jgi:hypothetical protein